jgi:hypothetical protein
LARARRSSENKTPTAISAKMAIAHGTARFIVATLPLNLTANNPASP